MKYGDFLKYVNGAVGPQRREILQAVFKSINGSEIVSVEEIKKVFDPSSNPAVYYYIYSNGPPYSMNQVLWNEDIIL